MADLPSELFPEILSRSPVQSLLRFRSISKSLKSLIDSHNFTNLHLKNSLNFNLILRHNSNLHQLDFPNLTAAIPLKHPLKKYISLLGSCNGLLCISNDEDKTAALWNPIIRKHRFIPYPTLPHSYGNLFVARGFTFDPFADDYKLVQISSLYDAYRSQVRLFSSKTNSWKALPSLSDTIKFTQTIGVFVENSLHWVVAGGCSMYIILAFNITQEIFNEVPLPEIEVAKRKIFTIDVSHLGSCLCITVRYETNSRRYIINKVDVWVMKEYGLNDSWCKLFTLDEWYFNTSLRSLKPLGYSSDRSKVLLEIESAKLSWADAFKSDYKKLFWYDLKSEKVTCVPGIPNFNEAIIYVGTLLPPSLPINNNKFRKENQPQFKIRK